MKFIAMVLMFFGFSQSEQSLAEDLSIRLVAGEFVRGLYQDENIELFVLNLPANAILPDHQTGPRIVILMSDLSGKRLADGSEFSVEQDQVLYLQNTYSQGFQNSTTPATYLVLDLKGVVLDNKLSHPCEQPSMLQLFAQDDFTVCKNVTKQEIDFHVTTMVYRDDHHQFFLQHRSNKMTIIPGDVLIEFHGQLTVE
ncbi:hypothetical protein [Marinicella litoralis]|uniref:Uncharacterized protein n=1 Tax=Marinicella litoralis TaxID=644220 RepID=A0A4R6XJ53_9GAMM|nr:hypothetical protein [Marinicella litoralis]TDR19535.1 hypothetical protein C8D91_2091 [Marinicella litoralis]